MSIFLLILHTHSVILLNFLKIESNTLEYNYTLAKVIKQNHLDSFYEYRLEFNDKIILICTNIELWKNVFAEIVAFCKNADLLIF